jgi:hypothetical protein
MLKGKFCITFGGEYKNPQPVRVEVEDTRAGVRFLSLRMTSEALAEALVGSMQVDCEFELGGLQNVGKQSEHKRERVGPLEWNSTDEEVRAAIAVYEVDGWRGRVEDAHNWHNRNREGLYEVSYYRWVDPPDAEE